MNQAERLDKLERAVFGDGSPVVEIALVLSADGPINPRGGRAVITKAGVAALTLLPPIAGTDDGKELTIIAATAYAHTITTASNVINGNASLATFGGNIGDFVTLIAMNGVWIALRSADVVVS